MKTAIQELIDWIEERFNNPKETEVFKKATELLEKEKEQMKLADKNGFDRSEYFRDLENVNAEYWGKQPKQFKEYYNQTYNQQ